MLLLNFKTPHFTSTQFANIESKEVWQQKINNAKKVYLFLEIASVKYDLRKAMIMPSVSPGSLDSIQRMMATENLFVEILEKVPASEASLHTYSKYIDGAYFYKIGISKSKEVLENLKDAVNRSDEFAIGDLIGIPSSSVSFYVNTIIKNGYYDPIWQQADNIEDLNLIKNKRDFIRNEDFSSKKLIRIKEGTDIYKISSVFRYLGVRILPYIPKSIDDIESIEIANKWIELARKLGIKEVDDLLDILQLPYEWSCYKGIAILNTPVFKVVTNSLSCYPNYIVQKESSYYPAEAPFGIQFPWNIKTNC